MMDESTRSGIYVGIDTHARTHHVAILDTHGTPLADRRFDATSAGHAGLRDWVESFGPVTVAAVEGTHSYGAGLTRVLLAAGWEVRETVPGDRADRRLRGKTDPVDAFTAARAALSGRARAIPKTGDGPIEQLRIARLSRSLLVRQQTQLMNQIKSLLVTAPDEFRARYRGLTRLQLAHALTAAGPAEDLLTDVLADSAHRWLQLRDRARTLETRITRLIRTHRPNLLDLTGVGPDSAARLLVAVSDHPDRVRTESQMAHLFGIAPIPASSGRIHRHRLDRGGDRSANAAIHCIALVRARLDPRTRDYLASCKARGKTPREAMRLLKRHLIRELHPHLTR